MCERGVTQEPPRNTYWLHELSVVLADARRTPGETPDTAPYVAPRPFPNIAEQSASARRASGSRWARQQRAVLDKRSVDRHGAGGELPFRLRSASRAPAQRA